MKRFGRATVFVAIAVAVLATGSNAGAAGLASSTLKWVEAHPAKSPPARDSAAIATDGDTVVMFGGETTTGGKILDDTWTWAKGAWKEQTGAHPPALAGAAMAYDPISDEIVLFGGKQTSGATSDATWIWSKSKWSEDRTKAAPSARVSAQMAYSPANKGVLLFSGTTKTTNPPPGLTDTWLFTSAGWRKLAPKQAPPGSLFGTMATDSTANQVMLFTGIVSFSSNKLPGETWLWNGTNWSEPKLSKHPSARIAASTAFDPSRKGDVLFGGFATKAFSDAWFWNGSSWSELTEKSPPKGRCEAAMAYDASSGNLLVFGGSTEPISLGKGTKDLSDTWLGGP